MDGNPVLWPHLVELVDADDAVVRKHHGTALSVKIRDFSRGCYINSYIGLQQLIHAAGIMRQALNRWCSGGCTDAASSSRGRTPRLWGCICYTLVYSHPLKWTMFRVVVSSSFRA